MLSVANLDLFYGDSQALDDVSLTVPEKEIVAIVGANGAGKTSLIRSICGMHVPASGSITFKGEEVAGKPSHIVCNLGLGQVAEGRQVFPNMSILDNLELGGSLPRAQANYKRNMDYVFELFPRLLERRWQNAGTLSGGEQQMLAIGRCLMSDPELILFDEPSLGLAPAIVHQVFDIIKKLHQNGMTIVLVEQNVSVSLAMSDQAYVLENGKVTMHGTGAELLSDERVRQAYLGM